MGKQFDDKFQRLWWLVTKLQTSKGQTVEELGAKSLSDKRRMQRDLETLREAGVPIQVANPHSRPPRYRLENLRSAGSQLDLTETLAVTLAVGLVGRNEVGELARRAWDKLDYAVVNGQERRAKTDLPLRVFSQLGWNLPLEAFEKLCTALLESYQLLILYRGVSDEQPRWRTIEPWQLFFQDRWYVRGKDADSPGVRNFRLDRIHELHLTEEDFKLPRQERRSEPFFHKWDLRDCEPVAIECWVEESLARWLEENPVHPTQTLEGQRFCVSVRDVDAFLRWVCSLSDCRIVSPPQVRELLRQRLELLLGRLDDA